MLHTTKGIIIHQFKYGEKSVIAKVYTQKFGLQSYIINGVRSKKSANKSAYLQALSLLEINAYHKENKGLQQVKNITLDVLFQSIPFNIHKTSIAFFIAEIIHKSIKEEEANLPLFDFLFNSILVLDLCEKNYNNFHIYFLALFAKYLGFPPKTTILKNQTPTYFDLQEGVFCSLKPFHPMFLNQETTNVLAHIIQNQYNQLETFTITQKLRTILLNGLLDYYKIHAINFEELKTLEVLENLFA